MIIKKVTAYLLDNIWEILRKKNILNSCLCHQSKWAKKVVPGLAFYMFMLCVFICWNIELYIFICHSVYSGFKKFMSNKYYEGEVTFRLSPNSDSNPRDGTRCWAGWVPTHMIDVYTLISHFSSIWWKPKMFLYLPD